MGMGRVVICGRGGDDDILNRDEEGDYGGETVQ